MSDDLRRAFVAEARELVEQLTLAALHVERERTLTPEQRRHVLRVAHTLKGAARVVGEMGIADAAHRIEDVVSVEGQQITDALIAQLLRQIDAITRGLPGESRPGAKETPADPSVPVPPGESPARSVRVDLAAIDTVLERLADVARRCVALRDRIADEQGERGAGQLAEIERLSLEVSQLRGQLQEFRLAPASTVFAAVERATRDAAAARRLRVRLETAGSEHRVDADLLDSVRDALIQLARNAAAHGIEPPEVRAAAGKPPEGVVTVTVERRGPDVAFAVSDDGGGLEWPKLRRAAERAGLVSPDADDEQLIAALLEGGLSTQQDVSQISGRGVGLDLVRAVTQRHGGRLMLDNRPGGGVTVTLIFPVTRRSLRYLRLDGRAASALVPLDAVRHVARLADLSAIGHDGRPHVVFADRPVPQVALDALLAEPADSIDDRVAAVIGGSDGSVAITAARFGEVATTVAQPLPALAGAAPIVRDLAVTEFGEIVPVLEPDALATASAPAVPRPPVSSRRRRLLVVDDSITTRMLEQSILEGAGFLVDTAASAEEALDRAARVRYDLFIVDVEMPGMNGFEFVAATRADEALAATPAILVTSRAAEADRRRGLEAGARAYIVKSEFDQEAFLNTVRGLVG